MTITFTLIACLAWLLLWCLPTLGFLYLLYYLISLPLRRKERARLLLHLIETGLNNGRSPESLISEVVWTQDRSLPPKFQVLASLLQSGLRLGQALDRIPGILPPQVVEMIKVGEHMGDIRKVLPACRGLLRDANSQTRSAMNYLLVLGAFAIPILPALTMITQIRVIPKFKEMFQDVLGGGIAGFSFDFVNTASILGRAQLAVILFFYILAFLYLAGPQSWKLINGLVLPIGDWIVYHLPWRRKRLQRDFASMLALMLDANVPEPQALQMAVECTANRHFIQGSVEAQKDMASGVPITQAISRIDDSGELNWRLRTAAQGHKGFVKALSGWLEALDAKAFQQEQAAAHLLTTFVVVFNGLAVGLFVIGVFRMLTTLLNQVVL